MKKSITPNQIKENNRNLIYQYIYLNQNVSQQDISYNLHLSRPTVTANLNALEEDGMIVKSGLIHTEYVGRKAAAYTIVSDFRVGIGVEILGNEIKILAADLYGREIKSCVHELAYKNDAAYFQNVCKEILAFRDSAMLCDEQILGVGFAIQGLISPDAQTVLYGKILACTGLSITAFSTYLPYPCAFIHDADSAATAELWISPDLKDAFYLSLGRHLGASLIADRKLITGDHGHSSTIEHIVMEPNGKLCYCGKRGCMETLCSIDALLEKSEDPDAFFGQVRSLEPAACTRWRTYLKHLARAINLLHLIYDKTFILGGYLAPYLNESDLTFLYEEIRQLTPFPESSDFLQISKMPKHMIPIGAALPFIQQFLML
ncbi:MAG: ROK family protein [Lachnospiraceae bacterium]